MDRPAPKRYRLESYEWIGGVLQSNPVIVSFIVKHLSVKDLNRAAMVCKLWEDCVAHEKSHRVMIHHYSTTTANMERDEERRLFGDKLYESFNHFSCEPRIMLVFTTENLTDKSSKYFTDYTADCLNGRAKTQWLRKTHRNVYSLGLCNHFSTVLPKSCEIFLCSSWGVIATDGPIPMEYEEAEGISALFLSDWPGVKFTSFRVRCDDHSMPTDALLRTCGLQDMKDPKALLCFVNGHPEGVSSSNRLMDELIQKYPSMAMGGAMVVNYSGPVFDYRKAVNLGGFIIEGDDVQTRSIILDSNCRGVEAVRAQFRKLEGFPMIVGRTTAILFSCSGRGQSFHLAENVEAGTFGRMFPGITLVGMFGNGELGYDSTLPADSYERRIWTHSYTSVLLVITFPAVATSAANVAASSTRNVPRKTCDGNNDDLSLMQG